MAETIEPIVEPLGKYPIVAITHHGYEIKTAALNFTTDEMAKRVHDWLRRNGIYSTIMSQSAYDEILKRQHITND